MEQTYAELFQEAFKSYGSLNFKDCSQLKKMRSINPKLTERFEKTALNMPLSDEFYQIMNEVTVSGGQAPETIVAKLERLKENDKKACTG